jgi:membrane protease YdiL (CAAX protease family)
MQYSNLPPEYPPDTRQYPGPWQQQAASYGQVEAPGVNAPRGHAAIAWGVIVCCIVLGMVLRIVAERAGDAEKGKDEIGVALMEVQSKYALGAADVTAGSGDRTMIYNSMEPALNVGGIDQRQRFVVLAGEMAGSEKAAVILNELDHLIAEENAKRAADGPVMSEEQVKVQEILRKLYAPEGSASPGQGATTQSDAAPATTSPAHSQSDRLSAAEKSELNKQLGWFGKLAEVLNEPRQSRAREAVMKPAMIVAGVIIAGAFVGLIAGCLGFVGAIVVAIFAMLGKLVSGLRSPATYHGIYAETFACWMVLFLILQIGAVMIGSVWTDGALLVLFVAFFASLFALAWPVFRGIPFATVRRDIGWTLGRQPAAEVALGPAGYLMGLPIFAIGVAITFGFLLIQKSFSPEPGPLDPVGGPSHPIIQELIQPNWAVRIQLLMLASIAAPIVEETMFRGVLFRHLRDATRRWGSVISIAMATAVNSFIFAIIHPQGWVAVPALMALAVNFSLMREWRGTLIPAMMMHAIQNGLVVGLLIFIFSLG